MREIYRGCLLRRLEALLRAGEWELPADMTLSAALRRLQKSARKKWNVRVEAPYRNGEGLAIYLARYLRGGPIGDSRLAAFDGRRVTIRYRDFRDAKRLATMELTSEEFTKRWLLHIPTPGHRVIRSYGLYHHALAKELESCRSQLEELGSNKARRSKADHERNVEEPRCPECGAPLVMVETVPYHQLVESLQHRGRPPPVSEVRG